MMTDRLRSRIAAFSIMISLVQIGIPFNDAFAQQGIKRNETRPNPGNASFEENRGQFPAPVRFYSRAAGMGLFLTGSEADYVLPITTGKGATDQKAYALRMRLNGAATDVRSSVEAPTGSMTNYLRGSDPAGWVTDVASYGVVRFEDVYSGVSMIWRGAEAGAVRFDFVVDPGIDPAVISLSFDGSDSVEIDSSGDLLIKTPAGTVTQRRPVTFQVIDGKQVPVESAFRIEDDGVRFEIGDYDHSSPLTIDPTVTLNNLAMSTFVGNIMDDQANAVAVDGSGNTYLAGTTLSPAFPTTPGTFDPTVNGGSDGFVTKINPAGSGIIYSTIIGGALGDGANSIVTDPSGAVYVCGNTASGDFPVTAGAYDTSYNGGLNGDGYALKLNASGNALSFSTFLGGNGEDLARAMAVDQSGNVFVTGDTQDSSIDFPVTAGAFSTTHNGNYDIFVAKLNPTASALTYGTFLGGSNFDFGNGIAVDAAGNAFVAGDVQSSNFPTTGGTIDTTQNGGDDVTLTKINTTGSAIVYSTFLGGAGTDVPRDVKVDLSGSAYLTGFAAAGFPSTAGAFDSTQNGGSDVFVSKVNPNGSALSFSTFLGGSGNDFGRSLALDSIGHVYVTGDTADAATDFPVSANAYDSTNNGGKDTFLARLDNSGAALVYSTFLGGGADDVANGLALDPAGNAYLAGSSGPALPPLPTTASAYQSYVSGLNDAFVAKFGDLSISGRVIDTNGQPLANVMVALSGQVTSSMLTGIDGTFGFLDTVPGEPHAVSASRPGYSINPAVFNISALNANRELTFVGAVGSPTGGAGGTLRMSNVSYTKAENGGSVSVTIDRVGQIQTTDPVTVDYTTVGGTAVAGQDYQPVNGVITFNALETSKTISIPLVNDGVLEPKETFTVAIANPTNNSDIEFGRASATVQILDEDVSAGDLVISEFRERGRLGAKDEYVKIFNPNDFDVTVMAPDGSAGLTVAQSTGGALVPVATIPNLVTIAARGHYLLTNNDPNGGFSVIDYPTGRGTVTTVGDQVFSADIPDNASLALLRSANANGLTTANLLDSVGFSESGWAEGKSLTAITSENTEMSYVRRLKSGGVRDTNNNREDFILVDNHATTFPGADGSKLTSALGAPAPETSDSLRMLAPETVAIAETGNESYDPAPVPNGKQGTLTVYRLITNNGQAPLTSLRLRAVDLPTFGSEASWRYSSRPDFRLTSSAPSEFAVATTLVADRLQPNGGGINSTLAIDSVTVANPLMPGQSIVVAVTLTVMRYGRHPIVLAAEGM